MSADNFLAIRKFQESFVVLHGFASAEQWPTTPSNFLERGEILHKTLEAAVIAASRMDDTEYGLSIHPECYPNADEIKTRQDNAARAIAKLTLQYLDGKLLYDEMESQIRLVLMEVEIPE